MRINWANFVQFTQWIRYFYSYETWNMVTYNTYYSCLNFFVAPLLGAPRSSGAPVHWTSGFYATGRYDPQLMVKRSSGCVTLRLQRMITHTAYFVAWYRSMPKEFSWFAVITIHNEQNNLIFQFFGATSKEMFSEISIIFWHISARPKTWYTGYMHGRRSLWNRGHVPSNIRTGTLSRMSPQYSTFSLLKWSLLNSVRVGVATLFTQWKIKRRTVDCLFMQCIVCVYG